MSALITSCAKSKPGLVYLHNIQFFSSPKKLHLLKAIFVLFFKQKDQCHFKNHIHLHSRVVTSRKRTKHPKKQVNLILNKI